MKCVFYQKFENWCYQPGVCVIKIYTTTQFCKIGSFSEEIKLQLV